MLAEDMLALHLLLSVPLPDCWQLTHPESQAKPESRRVMASREIAWFYRRYPSATGRVLRRSPTPLGKKYGIEPEQAIIHRHFALNGRRAAGNA
ncbi:MAG: hypothetical protein OXE53_18400 [Deltaproteobacteria bacterium]|nr:hypothetical protein [Deltaproteobacteria bacterium]